MFFSRRRCPKVAKSNKEVSKLATLVSAKGAICCQAFALLQSHSMGYNQKPVEWVHPAIYIVSVGFLTVFGLLTKNKWTFLVNHFFLNEILDDGGFLVEFNGQLSDRVPLYVYRITLKAAIMIAIRTKRRLYGRKVVCPMVIFYDHVVKSNNSPSIFRRFYIRCRYGEYTVINSVEFLLKNPFVKLKYKYNIQIYNSIYIICAY